jgi:hypothetical protein
VDRSQRPGLHPRPVGALKLGAAAKHGNQPPYPTANLELYDLASDPYETKNLASQHPDIVSRLKEKLNEIRVQGHS